MWELFCPHHGIPAFVSWVVMGVDPGLFLLTLTTWRDKVTSVLGRVR